MKTNQILMLTLLLLGVLLAREAQAFYNPSTGRWLSRDPVDENGFVRLTSNGTDDDSFSFSAANCYGLVCNASIGNVDLLGLKMIGLQEVVDLSVIHRPAGLKDDITPCIMVALLWKESGKGTGFDTTAVNPSSSARGIAQILTGTANDIQYRVAKSWGGSDPFYELQKGQRLRDHRFDPGISIFAVYIYLDDRYKATGSLIGALNAYGPRGSEVLVAASCLCSKCGGISWNPKTGIFQINDEQAAWRCLYSIHGP